MDEIIKMMIAWSMIFLIAYWLYKLVINIKNKTVDIGTKALVTIHNVKANIAKEKERMLNTSVYFEVLKASGVFNEIDFITDIQVPAYVDEDYFHELFFAYREEVIKSATTIDGILNPRY